RCPDLDDAALAYRLRQDPSRLVRADENEIGFDPALERVAVRAVPRWQRQRHHRHDQREDDGDDSHGALSANRRSSWASMNARTSSGSKRSNRLLHRMATTAGAPTSCGKRIAASPLISPRATARRIRSRTAAMMRESTSR